MTDIYALAQRRAEMGMWLQALGMMNTPSNAEDQVAADARYQLALEAYRAADREYQAALATMTADELIALARGC